MRALVFSGGGARIHYHAGAASVLLPSAEYGLLAGVSAGALVAAYLAQYKVGEEDKAIKALIRQVKRMKTEDVMEPWPFLGRVAGLWRSSFYSSEPLRELVRREISVAAVQTSGRRLRIGAVDIRSGELSIFTESCQFLREAVISSAAYPAVFEPGRISGRTFMDGGVRAYAPIGAAIEAGATNIDVVIPEPRQVSPVSRELEDAPSVAIRAVDIMLNELMLKDLRLAELHNALIKAGAAKPGKREVSVTVIRPLRSLGIDVFDFSSEKAAAGFEQGAEDARRSLLGKAS